MYLWRGKEEFEQETDKVVQGFAQGCRGQFCQLRFWLVSAAEAALLTAHAGDAGCGPCCCKVVAPLGTWVCGRTTFRSALRVLQVKLESQPLPEVVKTE